MIMLKLFEETAATLVPGGLLYRGFSNEDELCKTRTDGIFPEAPIPMDTIADMLVAISERKIPQAHVLGIIRKHCVSFSIQKHVACFYATSDENRSYYKHGYLAEIKLSSNLRALKFNYPCIFSGSDGTTWIYPRNLPLSEPVDKETMMDWHRMQSRAATDDEFLLANGSIPPMTTRMKITRIGPNGCDKNFLPSARTGELINISQ